MCLISTSPHPPHQQQQASTVRLITWGTVTNPAVLTWVIITFGRKNSADPALRTRVSAIRIVYIIIVYSQISAISQIRTVSAIRNVLLRTPGGVTKLTVLRLEVIGTVIQMDASPVRLRTPGGVTMLTVLIWLEPVGQTLPGVKGLPVRLRNPGGVTKLTVLI
jgi:hypothetical protein